MAGAMTSNVTITGTSGVAYAYAATGGNRGASANALNFMVPAAAAPVEGAKRPHLRLVRD
jgi:hypothetical protein